jgi:hypothetical protein
MKKFIGLLKTNLNKAYAYFSDEIEIADAKKLIKALNETDQSDLAATLEAFIADYAVELKTGETPSYEVMKAPTSKKNKGTKGKTPKGKTGEYHENLGLNVLDVYRLGTYNPEKHKSSKYPVAYNADDKTIVLYLRKMWFAGIKKAQADGNAYWFTRIVRHQIKGLCVGQAAKDKGCKGMPLPGHAEDYIAK